MAERGLSEAGDDATLNMSCRLMNGESEVNWRLNTARNTSTQISKRLKILASSGFRWGAPGARPPYGPKFSRFHAVFQKI